MEPFHVAIFVKRPLAGQVKTRLARTIGAERAASLYTAMLQDTVTLAGCAGARAGVILHDGDEPQSWLPKLPEGWITRPQAAGDLGQRLRAAVASPELRGYYPLLILGSDSPDLPSELLSEAAAALSERDLLLGPCPDGGVWCIGLRQPLDGLFIDIPWSQSATGAALRNRAQELGLNWADLRPWQDVDVWQDLLDLAARLAGPGSDARATRSWLEDQDGPWKLRPAPHGLE